MKSTGMRRVRGAMAILLLVMGCGACRSRSTPAPNFVLIVVDTLRADRLGSYGNDRGLTPFLDELAGRSTVFHRAYAQSSWTVPSVASLFTSSFPSQHRATTYTAPLPPASTTLAEVLHAHGYDAAAWSANTMIEGQRGFGRGFDHFEVLEPTNLPGFDKIIFSARAERIDEALASWVAARTKQAAAPTFLYVQYMEPHLPYAPSPEDLRRVSNGRALDTKGIDDLLVLFPKLVALRDLEDVYDASVATFDGHLRELFDALARLHFLDSAVVVVTSDHGDEFGDHGGRGHGGTLYDELIRVPLLVAVSGQTTRRDVDQIVSLVDVAPTFLELAGIPPPPSFEGRSFAPLLGGTTAVRSAAPVGFAFSELLPIVASVPPRHDRAVVAGAHKLLVAPDGRGELFDLEADPREATPLVDSTTARAALQAKLDEVTERVRRAAPAPAPPPEIDEKTRERLKALGYAG